MIRFIYCPRMLSATFWKLAGVEPRVAWLQVDLKISPYLSMFNMYNKSKLSRTLEAKPTNEWFKFDRVKLVYMIGCLVACHTELLYRCPIAR